MRTRKRAVWGALAASWAVLWSLGAGAEEIPSAAPTDRPAFAESTGAEEYAPFPEPGPGYVTDLMGVLTTEEEERIERWLWQVENESSIEIVVVVIDSIASYPDTPNGSIEEFAAGLFDRYGIGNMPANDGVLLLVAIGDRKARIELGSGYGGTRNADAQSVMSSKIVPRFAENDYAAGITDGVEAIIDKFAHMRVGWNWPLIIVLLLIPLVAAIAISLFMSGKNGWGWICIGLLVALLLLLWKILQALPRGRSSSWSSGGLGGFGGGFSGGGGATGSW